jgi:hypothetical protein
MSGVLAEDGHMAAKTVLREASSREIGWKGDKEKRTFWTKNQHV